MKSKIIIMSIALTVLMSGVACSSEPRSPLLIVYANGHLPVENVTVSITNPFKEVGILITSIEFEGQLPELRYFYHGIYGRIEKKGEL